MRKIGKILYRTVLVLLCIVLAVIIYFVAAQRLSGEQAPELFGFRQAAVVSGSMEPVFSPGDFIIYKEQSSYQAGDVILFRQEENLITHRITSENDGGFETKGDANNTADEEIVPREAVLGKMLIVLPHVGSVVMFLRSPLGILILLGSALALMWAPRVRKEGPYGY